MKDGLALEGRNHLTKEQVKEVRDWVKKYHPRWQAIGWTGRDITKAAETHFTFLVSYANIRTAHVDLGLSFGSRRCHRKAEPLASPNPGPAATVPAAPAAEEPAPEARSLFALSEKVKHLTRCQVVMNKAMIAFGISLDELDQYFRPKLDGIAASLDTLVQILKSYGPITELTAADAQQIKEQVQRLYDVWIDPQPQGDARD